jgi:hypothetical protein
MTNERAAQILKQLAESANDKERALSDTEFADIVSNVLGQDALPAFRSAGILP